MDFLENLPKAEEKRNMGFNISMNRYHKLKRVAKERKVAMVTLLEYFIDSLHESKERKEE